jgi:excisionase family DNA binding protein
MSQTILISLEKKELKELIKQCLRELGTPDNEPELKFTQKEAAKYLQISEPTLISWKKKGLIPYYQFPRTRRIYYVKSELKTVASQNAKTARPGLRNWVYL